MVEFEVIVEYLFVRRVRRGLSRSGGLFGLGLLGFLRLGRFGSRFIIGSRFSGFRFGNWLHGNNGFFGGGRHLRNGKSKEEMSVQAERNEI
jgi:hypothetical protein